MSPNTVLVTGCSSGIGAAVSRHFAQAGYDVYGWDTGRDHESAVFTGFDCVDVRSHETLVEAASRLPALSAVVACAGIGVRGPFVENGPASFANVIATNLDGTAFTALATFEKLKQGHGCLILIGSITAVNGFYQRAAYSASKAGVVSLARSLAAEWAQDGIRVLCVSPGFTSTPMFLAGIESGDTDYERLLAHTPQRTLISPEELAASIYSLAGEAFTRLTGANVLIDAGWDALSGF